MADEVLVVQGGVPATLRQSAAEIRSLSRSLSSDLARDEQDLAALQARLEKAKAESVKAGLEARIAAVRGTIAEERAALAQLATAWQQVNAVIQQRAAVAAQAGVPPPPQAPPPAPPAPPGAGGQLGAAQFGAAAASALTSQLGAVLGYYISIRAVVSAIHEILGLGLGTLKSWAERGVEINTAFEVLRVGLAATIAQNSTVLDAQGKELTGLEKINALQKTSTDLQEKLVAAAFRSGTGLEEFISAFKLSLPLALQMGASLDQTVEVVRRLTTTATALGVPFALVKYQISEILRGNITARTTLARELGLSTEDVRLARDQGTLMQVLIDKTEAFNKAEGQLGETMSFVSARAGVVGDKVLQLTTAGGFEQLKAVMREILETTVSVDQATGQLKFSPEAQEVVSKLKDSFTDFVDAVVKSAPLLAQVFGLVADMTGLFIKGVSYTADFLNSQSALGQSRALAVAESSQLSAREILRASRDAGDTGGAQQAQAALDKADAEVIRIKADLAATTAKMEANKQLRDSLNKGINEAEAAVNALAEKVKTAQAQAKTASDSPVTVIPTREDHSKDAGRRDRLDAEEQVLALKRQGLELDKQIAQVGRERGSIGEVEYAKEITGLEVAKATLAVKEAQARAEGARQATTEKNANVQSQIAYVLAQERVIAAQSKLEQVKGKADETVALAELEERRAYLAAENAEAVGKELSYKQQLRSLDLQAGLVAADVLAKEKARLEVLAAQQKTVQAGIALDLAEANKSAADKGTDPNRKVRASAEEAKAQQDLFLALQNEKLTREQIAVLLRRATDETVRLAHESASSNLRAQQLAGEASAEERVLAARRDQANVTATTTQYEEVQNAQAAARVRSEEDKLRVMEAQNRVAAAQLKLQQAQQDLSKALSDAKGDQNAPIVAEKKLALNRAIEDALRAQLNLESDQVKTLEDEVNSFEQITRALEQQISYAYPLGKIFDSIRLIGEAAGTGLNKALDKAIGQFQAVTKLAGLFAAEMRKAVEATEGSKKAGGITNLGSALQAAFGNGLTGLKEAFSKGGLLDIAGAVIGSLSSGIQQLTKPGTLNKILGGGQIGATIGLMIGGPMGAALGAAVGASFGAVFSTKNIALGAISGAFLGGPIGGILGGYFASKRKETARISKEIQEEIKKTVKALNDGSGTIGASLAALEKERAEAVKRLSGEKGGKKELKGITDQIDPIIEQLKQKQKQVFDQFDAQLRVLKAPQALQSIAQAIEDLNQKVKTFLDAGGDALKAQQFLALSLKQIYQDVNRSLTDQEKSTIDLLQQEIDLQRQRADVVKRAADQENQIRQQLGLTRVVTPAQNAAQQIRQIELDKKAQLAQIDRQSALLKAQTDGLAQIFGLTTDQAQLDKLRLDLTRQQTLEVIAQINAYKQFLQQNQTALRAALLLAGKTTGTGVSVPGVTGSGGLSLGGPTFQVNNVNIAASADTTPQEIFTRFVAGVRTGVGNRSPLLNSLR